MTIQLETTDQYDQCNSCHGKRTEEVYLDLVRVNFGQLTLVLCPDCAYKLMELLASRYYDLWGHALYVG